MSFDDEVRRASGVTPPVVVTPVSLRYWQTCPVCAGRGHVMQGFYTSVQVETYMSTGGTEGCRACGGRGIVQ